MEEYIKSHSETEIVNGCIALMQELVGEFEDYLDFMDIIPESEEERFTAVPIYDAVIFCGLGLEPPWVTRQVEFTRISVPRDRWPC